MEGQSQYCSARSRRISIGLALQQVLFLKHNASEVHLCVPGQPPESTCGSLVVICNLWLAPNQVLIEVPRGFDMWLGFSSKRRKAECW